MRINQLHLYRIKNIFLAQVIVNLNELVIQVLNTSYYEVAQDPETYKLDSAKTFRIFPRTRMVGEGP